MIMHESLVAHGTIRVDDVTEILELFEQALRIVASNYAQLASLPIHVEQVYAALCEDTFFQRGYARILAAQVWDAERSDWFVVGSMRMITAPADSVDVAPLEFMSLLLPNCGWPHFSELGFNSTEIVEWSRFAINSALLPASVATRLIKRAIPNALLTAAEALTCDRLGKSQIWAIMPENIVRMVLRCGWQIEAPSEPILLNVSDHSSLFQRYNRYWLSGTPMLYRIARSLPPPSMQR